MADRKTDEAEYLDREIMLAKDALANLKGEVLDSLKRSADVNAWTKHYPWQSLGTAAVTGVGAGWVAGGALWGKKKAEKAAAEGGGPTRQAQPEPMHAGARMVGGLGTMVGALVSGIVGAATQSVVEVVRETVRETLKPEPSVPEQFGPDPTTNGHSEGSPVE
jgi:hypothetical protein